MLTLKSLVVVQSKPHEASHQALRQASSDAMIQLGSVRSPQQTLLDTDKGLVAGSYQTKRHIHLQLRRLLAGLHRRPAELGPWSSSRKPRRTRRAPTPF